MLALLFVAVVAVACSPLSVGAANRAADDEIVLAQVIHRHGARTPIVGANETLTCGTRYQTGQLTSVGEAQLTQLGAWLRQNYQGTAIWPHIESGNYSYHAVYSRSTDLPRTLQSSASMLRGLFPNLQAYVPVINTVEFVTDLLCLVDAQMSFTIPRRLGQLETYPQALLDLLTVDDLRVMAEEVSQQGVCAELPNKFASCALVMQDIGAAYEAAGTLPQYPRLAANFSALNKLREQQMKSLFQFFAANATDDMRQRGSFGQLLAQRLIQNMHSAITHREKNETQQVGPAPYPVMFEYSVHDTTIVPLSATLGHNELMLPQFGQVLIMELVRNSTGGYRVRLLSGAPQSQGPEPVPYNIAPVAAYGMAAAVASPVVADIDGVPLDDFARFVNATLPQSSLWSCYLPAADMANISCDALTPPAEDNQLCTLLRQRCPVGGCPAGYLVNPLDLSCVATRYVPAATAEPLIPTAAFIVELIAAVVVGALIGKVLSGMRRARTTSSSAAAEGQPLHKSS